MQGEGKRRFFPPHKARYRFWSVRGKWVPSLFLSRQHAMIFLRHIIHVTHFPSKKIHPPKSSREKRRDVFWECEKGGKVLRVAARGGTKISGGESQRGESVSKV